MFRLAKFALAGSAVLGASLVVPRAARARGANPVATVAARTGRAEREARAMRDAPRNALTKKGFFDEKVNLTWSPGTTPPKGTTPTPAASSTSTRSSDDPRLILARRAVLVAAALAAVYAASAARAFYERALERSVKTLKRSLEETAALRLELDAMLAELEDVRASRDALAFQLGQSSAEVRSELQSAVLELAKKDTELELARRELADAASLAERESARSRAEVASLERTIRDLASTSASASARADADADAERRVDRALERAAATRVRFAVFGVPAALARERGARVGIAGTWSAWSLDERDIVFLTSSGETSSGETRLAATLALRAGDAYEYKFVVAREGAATREDGTKPLAIEWQPGPNRILVVPLPSPESVARDCNVVAASDEWTGATTEWLGGHEHSPVTARARAARAEDLAEDFAEAFAEPLAKARDAVSFAAVSEADRDVVEGVVVEGAPRDIGATKAHPR